LTEQFAPPICARIRATRDRLRQEALDRGEKEKARQLTQQGIAERLHLSLGAYAAYEKTREPAYYRRREIAKVFGLAADYFDAPGESREEEFERLREELAGTRGEVAGLRQEVADLRRELSRRARQPRRAAQQQDS